jgi:ATP-dependent helicase/nuclease subunit A
MSTPHGSAHPSAEIDHRVILASAGTGKTYQLTNRLIGLLARGVAPSEIVATTFTRKAAGEIMERVVERLCEAVTSAAVRTALSDAIGVPLTRDRCVDILATVAGSLDRFSVLTIDSFFQRIASVLALEISAGPDRRIADESEDASLREEALAAALEAADRSEIASLVRILYDGKPGAGVLLRIRQAVACGMTLLRETRNEPEIWRPDSKEEALSEERETSSAALRRIALAIRIAPCPLNKDGSTPVAWTRLHTRSSEELLAGRIEDFAAHAGPYIQAGTYSGKVFPPAALALYEEALEHVSQRLRDRLRERTRAARSILDRFESEYESLKSQRSIWRFEDVPRAVLAHISQAGLADVYFRLDGRVRHLLLDEFQDTSMAAFRLLEPLVGEIVANEPPDRSLFCVGDVKQSLYAWNGAEPELLPAVAERWPQIRRSSLAVSRRSSSAVLDAVNSVFGMLDSNVGLAGNLALAENWSKVWVTHEAHDATLPGEFNLLIPEAAAEADAESAPAGDDDDQPSPERATVLDSEIATAIERIALHRAACPQASIAVLVRSNRSIAPLIHALTESGIPASEEGAASLLDAAPCAVIRSLFHLADHPTDTAARFHVAHSPVGAALGLTDHSNEAHVDRIASELRAEVEHHGLAHTIQRLVESTGPLMSARELSRSLSLIQLARRLDADGRGWCQELVRAIDASRIRDPASTPVRVMTTHAAKGLEFDVVILTDLGTSMFQRSPDILGDRPEPLGPITRVTCRPSASLVDISPDLAQIMDRARNRVLMEGLCILYVAMTRARHVLDVIITGRSIKAPAKQSTTIYPGRLLAGAFARESLPLQCAGVYHAQSKGDWATHVRTRESSRPAAPAPPERVMLRLRHPKDRPSGRLARVSPSGLEGGSSRTLGDLLRPASDAGRSRGTILHTLFEHIEWIEDGTPTDARLVEIAIDVGATPEEALSAAAAFRTALHHVDISRWLSRGAFPVDAGESLDLWRERAFAARIDTAGEPVLLSGRFDRVVVRRVASGLPIEAVLLDYKTDSVTTGEMLDARAAHYAPQIRAYREAIVASTGLRPERVRCILLFTEAGRAVASSV